MTWMASSAETILPFLILDGGKEESMGWMLPRLDMGPPFHLTQILHLNEPFHTPCTSVGH
jgi:hypothetical protein